MPSLISFLITLIFMSHVVTIFADEPILLETGESELRKEILLFDNIPERLSCQLQDFMPQQALVSYMINFCSPIEVPQNKIDPLGRFEITKTTNAWFIEGVNTFTITSRNRMGMSNRQTVIFQIFTTGPRVEVNWPPVNTLIKQSSPKISATARVIYEGGLTEFLTRNFSLSINEKLLTKPPTLTASETDTSLPEFGSVSLKEGRSQGISTFEFTPDWSQITRDSLDTSQFKIALEVSSYAKDAFENTKPYKACWIYEKDDIAPTILISGPPSASPLKDSLYEFQVTLDDNKCTALKDVRIRLFKQDKSMEWIPASDEENVQFLPTLSCGLHSLSLPLRKPKPGFFDKLATIFNPTSNLLADGSYKIEIRARDLSVLDPEHYQVETQLGQAYQKGDDKTLKRLYRDYYEHHYSGTMENQFNYALSSLVFSVDITPPHLTAPAITPNILTSSSPDSGITLSYTISEKCEVTFVIVMDKKIGEKSVPIEMYRETAKDIEGGQRNFLLNLRRNPELLPDGNYHFECLATDAAGNHSDTLKSQAFTIDQSPPIIQEFIIPSLTMKGAAFPIPSGEEAQISEGTKISLHLTAFDLFMGETLDISSTAIGFKLEDGPGTYSLTLSSKQFQIEKDKTRPYHFTAEIPADLFPAKNGKYYITLFVSDSRNPANIKTASEPIIKGAIPPKITFPLPFSEVAGSIVLKGVAKDPNWADGIRFSHYEIEYRKISFDKTNSTWSADSKDWEIAGMTVPASYRNNQDSSGNTSQVPVTEGGVIGIWNTLNGASPLQGYYQVRLLVFDRNFHPEFGPNPLDNSINQGTWAADTSIFYVYNDTAIDFSAKPIIKITAPTQSSVRIEENKHLPISFELTDTQRKSYDVKLEVREKDGRIIADTVFHEISGDNTVEGAPGDFNRLGCFIYKEKESWHIHWNSAGTERRFSGFIRFQGPIKASSPEPSLSIDASNDEAGFSSITFDTTGKGELFFNTSAGTIDFKLSTYPNLSQSWLFIGKNRKPSPLDNFSLSGGATNKIFLFNGKNKYGYYPPPGSFDLFAQAIGTNGMGAGEDKKSIFFEFPFGLTIDHISDTLFEMDTSTLYKDLTIYYRPAARCYVSIILLDSSGNSYLLSKDSLHEGRSNQAEAYAYTWNFNIHENQLINDGKYRIIMKAASDTSVNAVTCSDTSKSFRLIHIKTYSDNSIAMLDIKGDTSIAYNGSSAPIVNGKSDFRFFAKGKGKSYKDIPFKYLSSLTGKQSVTPHGFERFTVKARRGFKKLHYKVRVNFQSSYYYRATCYSHRNPKKGGGISFGNKFTTTYNLGLLSFADMAGGQNTHAFSFSARTPDEVGIDKTIHHTSSEPRLVVYFLPNNFSGPETPAEWGEHAWEILNISYDEAEASIGSIITALPSKDIWLSLKDSIYYSDEDYKRIISLNLELSADFTKQDKTNNYSQFYVKIKDVKRWMNGWSHFFHININFEFGTRSEIWDKDFSRHGFNSLVNRYTTWDSDNSIFYNHGKGLIALDEMDNDFDGKVDQEGIYAIATGSKSLLEDDLRFISDVHTQAFDFKKLMDPDFKYTPLLFSGLEEGPSPSVEDPYWEFKLCGKPNKGNYSSFAWASAFTPSKTPSAKENYTAATTTFDPLTDEVKIRIDNDTGPRGIMVWCKEAATATAKQKLIEWPITPLKLDVINQSDPDLLKQYPPGYKTDQLFIPYFGGNVRYGINDSLDVNPRDGHIDAAYSFPIQANDLLQKLNTGTAVNQTIDSGIISLKSDGRYCFDICLNRDIVRFGENVTPFPKVDSILTNIPIIHKEQQDTSGLIKVTFSPLNVGPTWTTSNDPLLSKTGQDFPDSLDNDQDLQVDEDASGYLMSDPIAFNPNGFASLNRTLFTDGYPKLSSTSPQVSYIYSKDSAYFRDNPQTTIDTWDVSLRNIDGSPNKDLFVTNIKASQTGQFQNDLTDYFTIRLKDNVFVPRKLIEVSGIAKGDEYKLLVRDGKGWNKIEPIVRNPVTNQSADKRVLAYWDISGLSGSHTLLLQVRNNGKLYQASQHLFTGQPVGKEPQTLYSTHSRSRLDLPANSLDQWGDTAIVSITARHLNELSLSKQPAIAPVGPIIEIKPSPATFPEGQQPKLTIHFTYPEAKSNGWLEENLNFYSLNSAGELDIIENSTTSFYKTDSNGTQQERLPNKSAFIHYGDSTLGRGIMQIAAETSHWSDFALIIRPSRTCYVDNLSASSGNGRSWKSAFKKLDQAIAGSYAGDTIKICEGEYILPESIAKNLILIGGYSRKTKIRFPSKSQTRLKGKTKFHSDLEVSGCVFESPVELDSCYLQVNRSAFSSQIIFVNSKTRADHCTFNNTMLTGTITDTLFCFNSILKSPASTISIKAKECAWTNPQKSSQSLFTGDPGLSKDLTLMRTSPVIDLCKERIDSIPVSGLFPDPGFDEFAGDIYYVSSSRGDEANSGKNPEQPLKTIPSAIRLAQTHDIIRIAQGSYPEAIGDLTSIYLYGGFSDDFKNRSPFKIRTRILQPLKLSKDCIVSGISMDSTTTTGIQVQTQHSRIDSCWFKGKSAAIQFSATNAAIVSCCVFEQNECAILSDRKCGLGITNNTFVNNTCGIRTAQINNLLLRNNLFYDSKSDVLVPGGTTIQFENNLTYKSASSIPVLDNSNICSDPRFVDESSSNYWLQPNSPCRFRGKDGKRIGALGVESNLKDARGTIFALPFESNLKDLVQPLLNLPYHTIDSSTIRFTAGYTDAYLYFAITNRPTASQNDTLSLSLAVPTSTSKPVFNILFCDTVMLSPAKQVKCIAIQDGIILQIPNSLIPISELTTDDAILFDLLHIHQGHRSSFNGTTKPMPSRSELGLLVAKDNIRPIIQVSNIKRFANHIIRPIVDFKHCRQSDICSLTVNNKHAKSGQEFYLEGDYLLKALVLRNNRVIADTTIRFCIDLTPPILSVSDLPPDDRIAWHYSADWVAETEAAYLKPQIFTYDKHIASLEATLNGKSYPKTGQGLSRQGIYAFIAQAWDSAGNMTTKELIFRLIPKNDNLAIRITSHRDLDSTNASLDTIFGWISSNTAELILNNDTIRTIHHFRDSTTFTCPVHLDISENLFTLTAYSKLSGQKAVKELRIYRDTAQPQITILSPSNGQKFESNTLFWDIPVQGTIISAGTIRSITIKTPFASKETKPIRIDNTHYRFIDEVLVKGEAIDYPILVEVQDSYGNRNSRYIVIGIGQRPLIFNYSPVPFSTLNTATINLKGTILEKNLLSLFIQHQPVPWIKQGLDSNSYDFTVNLPNIGENRITIRAEDSIGFADSITLLYFRDNIAPVITIQSPPNNLITASEFITVTGQVDDPFAYIFIGKDSAAYPPGTSFKIPDIRLNPGINNLTISARDTAYNFSQPISITVIRTNNSIIYVDSGYSGPELGTQPQPFHSLSSGVAASSENGTLIIRKGTYNETCTFKRGMTIQGSEHGVFLVSDALPYLSEGSLSLSGINLGCTGATLFEATGGTNFLMANCTLSISNKGFEITGYKQANIRNCLFRANKAAYNLSLANCDSILISNCRFNVSGDNAINISDSRYYLVRNSLFKDLAGTSIIVTNSSGTITYCTFFAKEQPSALLLSGGSTLLKNCIFQGISGYIVQRTSPITLTATFNDFSGIFLGLSIDSVGFDLISSHFTNPLFAEESLLTLQSASPLKSWGENSTELGCYGSERLGRQSFIAITSPPSGIFVSGKINIRTNSDRYKGNYRTPEIVLNNSKSPLLIPPDASPANVWGIWDTKGFESTRATITLGQAKIGLVAGLPKVLAEIPFSGLKNITFLTPRTILAISASGDSRVFDINGNERLSTQKSIGDDIPHTLTTTGQKLALLLSDNFLTCLSESFDTLFTFGGWGKTPYTLNHPTAIASSDSLFAIADSGNNRIMIYRLFADAQPLSENEIISEDNPIALQNAHFIPSPFRPAKQKGYIRYNLNRSAEVTITIYDRVGRTVKQWDCSSGAAGGRMGVNEIEWNGTNGHDIKVNSGIYAIVITAKASGREAKTVIKMSLIATR